MIILESTQTKKLSVWRYRTILFFSESILLEVVGFGTSIPPNNDVWIFCMQGFDRQEQYNNTIDKKNNNPRIRDLFLQLGCPKD